MSDVLLHCFIFFVCNPFPLHFTLLSQNLKPWTAILTPVSCQWKGGEKSSSKFVATEEADDDSGGGAEFKFEVAPAAALSLLCLHQSTRPPSSSQSPSSSSSQTSSSSSQIKSNILTITACTGDCKDGGFQASRSPKLTSDIVHAITMSNNVQSWQIMTWWFHDHHHVLTLCFTITSSHHELSPCT